MNEEREAKFHPDLSRRQLGGQSTAAAKTGDKGGQMSGAASVSEGVWMYQLTDKGLAAEISATGTKYYKDGALN
jgi:hypothetical protein